MSHQAARLRPIMGMRVDHVDQSGTRRNGVSRAEKGRHTKRRSLDDRYEDAASSVVIGRKTSMQKLGLKGLNRRNIVQRLFNDSGQAVENAAPGSF